MLGSARDGAPGAPAPAPPGGTTSRLRVCMASTQVGPISFSAGARGPAPAHAPPLARAGARGPSK